MEITNILKTLKKEKDNYINWLPNEIINIIINNLYIDYISNESLFKRVVDFLKRNINKKVYIEYLYDEFNGNVFNHEGIITIKTINDFTDNSLYAYGVPIVRPSQIKFTDENDAIYNIYDNSHYPINNNNTQLKITRDRISMNSYFIKECINDE